MRNVLQVTGLLRNQSEMESADSIVVDYARARDLIDTEKHAVLVSRVPGILNASRPLAAALIDNGHLTRVHDHDELKSKFGKAIDGRGIQKVHAFIKGSFPSVAVAPNGFAALAKSAERLRFGLGVIVELLFDGHHQDVCRLDGVVGMDAILVDLAGIRRVLDSPPPGVSPWVYYGMF